ncbi:MAG: helicase-exonuclease AddAB subunit AddA [Clostridia bacterium]|nr:helicase-exonuclease AddAB subunit AddA [Clostridia bacterium]
MAVEFTREQKMAIESRDCGLIVSAAAGSGKTAVLVQRVIGLLTDPVDPCSVDELLVVTFTNAAAAEMREKITKALYQRMMEDPSNTRLRRQLSLLPAAKIQTVHSFCMDLVREHFALCGVPADFGIADQARADELRAQAMEDALEELYAEGSEDFMALCSALAEEKGDQLLSDVIAELYDRLISHPDPMGTLERFTSAEGQGIWKEQLLREAALLLEDAREDLQAAFAQLQSYPVLSEKYGAAYSACLDFAKDMEAAIARDWNTAYTCIHAFSNPKLAAVRGFEDKALLDYFKGAKNAFSDAVSELRSRIFLLRDEENEEYDRRNQLALQGLRRAVAHYTELYKQLKLRRSLLDFSDLEHYALALLQNADGSPSDLALEVSDGLREILVDEYQDTNDIQDTIFRLLSARVRSSFYVGDVKQSIYRFRMAKPEIFMDKYLHYTDLTEGMRGAQTRLSLNRNFRSRREVLEACNHVFRACMSRSFGDVDYGDDQALYPGAPYTGEMKAHMEIIDLAGSGESDDEDSPARTEAEAIYVANTIQDMLASEAVYDPYSGTSRPAEPRDFAILLSSFANKSGYFIRELERLGIPVSGGKKDFWHSMEILVMVSFLRVLDNRRQDIPLIGLLRSPLFFFSADDLAAIRLENKQAAFWEALCSYAEKGDAKAVRFRDMAERYAAYVPDMAVSDLVRMLYSERSVLAVFGAMDGGEERKENLRRFYELALGFEGGGHRGLFDFLLYIDRLMEQDSDPGQEEGDGVRVMSIHKSKGLEFPFVFLPDLNKTFNFDDARRSVVIHDRLGIGMRLRVPETHTEYCTPMHMAISAVTRRELASEEMRKLYVAMTRAKEKLILVTSLRNYEKTMDEIENDLRGRGITPGWLSRRSNASAWLLAAFRTPCTALSTGITPIASIERRYRRRRQEEGAPRPQADASLMRMLEKADAPYPYAAVSALPSKLTPQGTRRLREEDEALLARQEGKNIVLPYGREQENGEARRRRQSLTAAQRGSAVHRFLQNADLAACRSGDVIRSEIERLHLSGVLNDAEAAAVSPDMILGFSKSIWGRRLCDLPTEKVIREYEFAALFSPDELELGDHAEEQILMNGIIDLLLVEDDGLTVIDFKTDRIAPGSEPEAVARHRLQVEIYAKAAEKIFGLPVREKLVFFLRTGVGQPI